MTQSKASNKIKFIYKKQQGRLSALCLWVSTGSKHDSIGGISHFLEHMIFKGNCHKTAKQLAEEIENTGAIMNAYTIAEATAFQLQFLDEQLDDVLKILAEMLMQTEFKKSEIELERNVILEEIKASLDCPEERLTELVFASLWPTHKLGKPIAGTLQSVSDINKKALQKYYKDNYIGENFTIACVSSIDEATIYKKIKKFFPVNQFKQKKEEIKEQSTLIQVTEGEGWFIQRQEIKKDLEHAYIQIAFPFQTNAKCLGQQSKQKQSILSHSEKIFFQALSYLLTEGFSSRLFQELREKQGLVYSLNSKIESYEEGNFWGLYFSATQENVQLVIEVIQKVISQIVKNKKPFSSEEIERAQKYLVTQAMVHRQNGLDYAEKLGFQQMLYGKILEEQDLEEEINKLKNADELNERVQKFFTNVKPFIVSLSPKAIKIKKV